MMKRRFLSLTTFVLLLSLFAGILRPNSIAAAPSSPPTASQVLTAQLQREAGAPPRISYHALTGKVRFLSAAVGHSIPRPSVLTASAAPEQAARAFLSTYGAFFGLADEANELRSQGVPAATGGRTFVRFQQIYAGIPVLAGELTVQLDSQRNVLSANGELLPHPAVDLKPTVDATQAQQSARTLIARQYKLDPDQLAVTAPALWIYNPILLDARGPRITTLAWRLEVTSDALPIRELVLVDAQHAIVILHFNQIDSARNRTIYDNANVRSDTLPGSTLVRTEGQAPIGNADADNAYLYAGDTYDFYANVHSRDSIDGAGMGLVSTVRYCPTSTSYACPYPNAFWNGSQMVYGQSYASADDVVAHEMTHGVTQYESRLFYYMQSGAINEALSDIWGEFVDLTNGHGNDSPAVRWLLGEDLSIGAIRSLSNPPLYSDPDRMTSSLYNCDPNETDNGGVHTNSGVANKAAYLMTDGDTFNGQIVSGLGERNRLGTKGI